MPSCHLCGSLSLSLFPQYAARHRVTSDCKPWPPGGELGCCTHCGAAQAVISPQWAADARAIYEAYAIYHQSGGIEQSVFDAVTGAPLSRSARLVQRLKSELPLPPAGRLLDVGCGNGATLRAVSAALPAWSLAGNEVNDHTRAVVEAIPRVEALYTGSPHDLPGQFDVITMIHALEHIAQPAAFLGAWGEKLTPGGLLVVQVPDCWCNAFMFLVADHATHFFLPVLQELIAAAGFEILAAADNWVPKELTVVARKPAAGLTPRATAAGADCRAAVSARLDWLQGLIEQARSVQEGQPLAIFGTSIAATWLTAELGERVVCYVDEDPHRAGQQHLGRPIYAPASAPSDGVALIALPPAMAADVQQRLRRGGLRLETLVPSPLRED